MPRDNLIALPMSAAEAISWQEFVATVWTPLQDELVKRGWLDAIAMDLTDAIGRRKLSVYKHRIAALVVCRGVPLKINHDPALYAEVRPFTAHGEYRTNAGAVDAELSLLAQPNYPINAFVTNPLFQNEKPSVFERAQVVEVARLDGIITNFLEAIRPSPPDLAETNLADVLAEVLRFQQREFADRGLAVEAENPATLPPVMADRNQLKQVFFNLTKNAMEAMASGGKLKIKSRADDDSVYLLFGDSGAGIKQEELSRLFQPYHTTKPGGHGLGLLIVQRIMREHGGQVGLESKEGVGTIVTLQFPRKDRRVRMLPR